MLTENRSLQLFVFSVPGLQKVKLAITEHEMIAITKLEKITALPLTPPWIVGVSLWEDNMLTVIDLAKALKGNDFSSPVQDAPQNYLVARIPVGDQMDMVAWNILPGAQAFPIPPQAPQVSAPADFSSGLTYPTVRLSNQRLTLLNLESLVVGKES